MREAFQNLAINFFIDGVLFFLIVGTALLIKIIDDEKRKK